MEIWKKLWVGVIILVWFNVFCLSALEVVSLGDDALYFDLVGSRHVIGHVTIRFLIDHFLFASSDSSLVRRAV